jgi:hypothetical protein
MGSKLSGLFLYVATHAASSSESPLLASPWPAWLASDSSTLGGSSDARGWRCCSGPRIAFGSPRLCVSASTFGLGSPPPRNHGRVSAEAFASEARSAGKAVRESFGDAGRIGPSCDTSAASAQRNSAMPEPLRPQHGSFALLSAAGWREVFAFPILRVFQKVSCLIV